MQSSKAHFHCDAEETIEPISIHHVTSLIVVVRARSLVSLHVAVRNDAIVSTPWSKISFDRGPSCQTEGGET